MSKRVRLRQMSDIQCLLQLKSLSAVQARNESADTVERARLSELTAYHELDRSISDWENRTSGDKPDPVVLCFLGDTLTNCENLYRESQVELTQAQAAFERLTSECQQSLVEMASFKRQHVKMQTDFCKFNDEKVMCQVEDRMVYDRSRL